MNRKERRKIAFENGEIGQEYRESLKRDAAMKPVANAKPIPPGPIEIKAQQIQPEMQTGTVEDKTLNEVGSEKSGLGSSMGLIGETKPGRLIARAANWQQTNRFPLNKAVVDGKIVEPTEGQLTIYEEIAVTAAELMRAKNNRTKGIGARAAATLAKIVQADDHAKLRAELRPTPIAPTIIDQSVHNHTDNRRVMLMLPDNNRDPDLQKIAGPNVASE